jgi:hypothetical protein
MGTMTTVIINGRNVQIDLESPCTYKQLQHLGRIVSGITPNMTDKPSSEAWGKARKVPATILGYFEGKYPSKGWVQKILDMKTPKLPKEIEKLITVEVKKVKKVPTPSKPSELDIRDIIAFLKSQGLEVTKAS